MIFATTGPRATTAGNLNRRVLFPRGRRKHVPAHRKVNRTAAKVKAGAHAATAGMAAARPPTPAAAARTWIDSPARLAAFVGKKRDQAANSLIS
jgi:hypothetical protein